MKYTRIGIFSEKEEIALSYQTLLEEWGKEFEYHLLDQTNFALSKTYDILIIDFTAKKYRPFVNELINAYNQNAKMILICPYFLVEIHEMFDQSEAIDLVLTKPFNYDRLVTFIRHHTKQIDRRMMLETKNTVLAEVVDLNPSRIGVFNSNGVLFYANTHYLEANLLTISDVDTLHFDEISECKVPFETIKHELKTSMSFNIQRQEGSKWLKSYFYNLSQTEDLIVHICEDITSAKQYEIQLEQSAIFFEQSSEALLITDMQGVILSVNAAFCKITGYTKDEAVGKTPKILASGMQDQSFYQHLWSSLVHNGQWQGEIWNKRKNGEIYPEWLSINKAISTKYNEEFYICVFTDISSVKETDRKLYFYANHDPLTGLANRVQFEAQLKKNIDAARRRNEKLALFFIDLDKFKEVNDTYGHTIGDLMLKNVTKRLSESIRADDFLSRLGGDEFVIIASNIDINEGITTLASKLFDTMKDPIVIDQKVFFMTLSIGIAIYPDNGEDAENLIKHADAAMYEVKENGRNGFMLYEKSFSEKLTYKIEILNDLKAAMDHDDFELFYQPVINLETNTLIGAEALIRWHHQKKGLLYPGDFISFVENSELIYDFGMMIFKKAFQDLSILNTHVMTKEPFSLSINIAPKQFFEDQFVEKLTALIHDFGIDPHQIELEILETQIMKNPNIAQSKFEKLHSLGFKLALDDFGTGYSSLSYLKNFTIDKLKIDQSFIRDFLIDDNDRAIVQAIITMAKIFGTCVQAEGVETQEHEAILKSMNCELSQGYLYAKPLALPDFIEWCKV